MIFRNFIIILFLLGITSSLKSQESQGNYPSPDPKNCYYDADFGAYHCYNPQIDAHYYYYSDGTYFYPGHAMHVRHWNDSRKWTGMGSSENYHDLYPSYSGYRDSPYRNNRNQPRTFEHNDYYYLYKKYPNAYPEHPEGTPYPNTREYGWWWNGKTWHWGLGRSGHHSLHRERQQRDIQENNSP